MYNAEADKAKFHFYFTTEILGLMRKNKMNCGDLFGYGEDCFVIVLYEYSVLIFDNYNNSSLLDSSLFDVCKVLSIELFSEILDSSQLTIECKLPEINKFKGVIHNVIKAFINR